MLSSKTITATILAVTFGFLTIHGYPNGAPNCLGGIPGVTFSDHDTKLAIFNATVTFGTLAQFGFTIAVDGAPLIPGVPASLVVGVDHTILLTGPTYRGFLIRLGRGPNLVDTRGALSVFPNSNNTVSQACAYERVAGITHFVQSRRNFTRAVLNFNRSAYNLPLDVTVVIRNDYGRPSQFVYSPYTLNFVDPPTFPPPTTKPTNPKRIVKRDPK